MMKPLISIRIRRGRIINLESHVSSRSGKTMTEQKNQSIKSVGKSKLSQTIFQRRGKMALKSLTEISEDFALSAIQTLAYFAE